MWVDTSGSGTEGPFQHYDATPESIEASAVELDRSYGNVEALSRDVGAAQRPALTGVSGMIAGPITKAPEPQRRNARDVMAAAMVAAGSVRIFGRGVRTFNSGVDSLNQRWREAVASDFGIAAATYPHDADFAEVARIDNARNDQVLTARVTLLKELETEHGVLTRKLDDQADEAAARLHAGPTDAVIQDLYAAGGLPSYVVAAFPHLKLQATTLPPDLASMNDEELADYALQHPERAAELLPLLNERTKQLLGEAIAEQADQVGDDPTERAEGFKDEIDSLDRLLSAYGQEPVVATSFLNTLGPRGLLELNARISTALLDTNDLPSGHPEAGEFDADYATCLGLLQVDLARVLATGTSGQPWDDRGWNGDGSATHVSADWTHELIAEGEAKFSITPAGTNRESEIYGYQLLAPLLSEGDHSPEFLNLVGSSMLSFETSYVHEHGHQPWMDQTDLGVPADGVRLDWMHGTDDHTDPAGWDPMAGLMRGLSNDPEASRDFFTGDVTQENPPRYPRLDYLLTDRRWGADAPWLESATSPAALGTSTLGDALKAATLEDPDPRSVHIVEAIVREISIDEEARGYDDHSDDTSVAVDFANQTLVDPPMVDALGDITAHYIGSFNLSLTADDPAGALDYLFDDARFEDAHARRFLAELGKDPETAGLLTAASRSYAAFDFQRQLTMASPELYDDVLEKVSRGTGAVAGAIDFGASSAIQAHHEFDDAQFNAGVSRGFDLANSMKSLIPMPSLVSDGVDVLLGQYEDTMMHNHIGVTNFEVGNLIENEEQQQQEFLRKMVWNSIPADRLPSGFEPGVDPEVQMDRNEELRAVYERWTLSANRYGQMLYDLDGKQPFHDGYDSAQTSLDAMH